VAVPRDTIEIDGSSLMARLRDKDNIPAGVKAIADKVFDNSRSTWAKKMLEEAKKPSFLNQFTTGDITQPVASYTRFFHCRKCNKHPDDVAVMKDDYSRAYNFRVICHNEQINYGISEEQFETRRTHRIFPINVFEPIIERPADTTERRDYRSSISSEASLSSSTSSRLSRPRNAKDIAKSRPKEKPSKPKDDIFSTKVPKKRKRSLDI
jgi:hypothetical protein